MASLEVYRIPGENPAIRCLAEDGIVARLHNRAEQLLALAPRRLRLEAGGHVGGMNQSCAVLLERQVVGPDLDLERRAILPAVNPEPGLQVLGIAGQRIIEAGTICFLVYIADREGEKLLRRIAVLRVTLDFPDAARYGPTEPQTRWRSVKLLAAGITARNDAGPGPSL